jgi:hypothetical protein
VSVVFQFVTSNSSTTHPVGVPPIVAEAAAFVGEPPASPTHTERRCVELRAKPAWTLVSATPCALTLVGSTGLVAQLVTNATIRELAAGVQVVVAVYGLPLLVVE